MLELAFIKLIWMHGKKKKVENSKLEAQELAAQQISLAIPKCMARKNQVLETAVHEFSAKLAVICVAFT